MSWDRFLESYKNDLDCLEVIIKLKFPDGLFCENCSTCTRFYKVKDRPLYECSCGYQISPLVGTIFENSHASLVAWFYAIFVMSTTRCGYSAAHLQRDLGVNYKTAWRMLHKIRKAMQSDDSEMLKGVVEIDETYVGWRLNYRYKKFEGDDAAVVMGMVERGGRKKMIHVPTNSKIILLDQIFKNISKDAHIMSDQLYAYRSLSKYGYKHDSVLHRREYVRGDVSTQTVESGWGQLKRSLSGTYHRTSKEYLQNYLNEFSWRYNHRKHEEQMFEFLVRETVIGLT